MSIEAITAVAKEWNEKTYDVLDLREIPPCELEKALRNTYEILHKYQTEKNIPKEVCQMLLNEDEFMSFLVIVGANQDELKKTCSMYQALYCIIDTMKQNFLGCGYKDAFPLLKVDFNGTAFQVNMDKAFLENFI